MVLNVPFWIDLYWWGPFLTILALFSVRHKFLCIVQGRGWREKMDVGAARRGQASACSTDIQTFHTWMISAGDIHQPRAIYERQTTPSGVSVVCGACSYGGRETLRETLQTHGMRRIYGGKGPRFLTAPTSEVPSLTREVNAEVFRAFKRKRSGYRVLGKCRRSSTWPKRSARFLTIPSLTP